jgi:hypothetical protein
MLTALCAPIKLSGPAVPCFGHMKRELSVISGLDGGVDPGFGLIDTHLDKPVEPLSTGFCR